MSAFSKSEDQIIQEGRDAIALLKSGLGFEDIRVLHGDEVCDRAKRIVSGARRDGWIDLIYPKVTA